MRLDFYKIYFVTLLLAVVALALPSASNAHAGPLTGRRMPRLIISADTTAMQADSLKGKKEQKDAIDARNEAVSLVYQTEKSLGELGGKISDSEKAPVEAALNKLKETLKGSDVEAIKADAEALMQAFYAGAEKMYAQANPQGAPGADMGAQGGGQTGPNGETVYDADYKVVDDEEQK